MKLLYLGYICSSELFNEILKKDAGLSPSRQRWEMGMFKSMELTGEIAAEDVTVISFLPETDIDIPEHGTVGNIDIRYITSQRNGSFGTVKKMMLIRREIKKWLKETKDSERIVFTYSTNPVLLIPFFSVKPRDCKIISACSELPAFRIYEEKLAVLSWIKKNIFQFLHNKMSGYVFFSKHDNDVANKHNKPWMVCEGMAEIPFQRSYDGDTDKDVIFYAGGLNIEYGIKDLVDAFMSMNRDNTELWLCGNGNAEQYINECLKKYPSIKYFGRVSNQKVAEMEASASVLINPRPKDLMLTKYSFPSKTLEYMASGTPAMIRRLDGIPDEYYEYAYIIENDGAEGIELALKNFFEIPKELRYKKAKDARDFVERFKTPLPQTKKMLEFLKKEAQNGIV